MSVRINGPAAYATERINGICVRCKGRAANRLCGECGSAQRAKVKAEKQALRFGRERAREAR